MKKWDEDYLRELTAVMAKTESREREEFDQRAVIFGDPFTDEDINLMRFSHDTVAPIWESCLFALKNDPFSFFYDYDEVSVPIYPFKDIFDYISQLTLLGKYRLTHYFHDVDDNISAELADAIFNNDSKKFQQIANDNNLDIIDFRKRITSAIVLGEELDSVYSDIEYMVTDIESFDDWASADEVIKELNRRVEKFPKAYCPIIKKIQGYLIKQLREYDYDIFDEKYARLTGINTTGSTGFLFLFLSYTVSLFLLLMPKMEQTTVCAIKDFLFKSEKRPILKGILRLLYIISKDDCQSETVFQPEYFHFKTMSGPFVDYLDDVGMDIFVKDIGPTRAEMERLGMTPEQQQERLKLMASLRAKQEIDEKGKPEEKNDVPDMNRAVGNNHRNGVGEQEATKAFELPEDYFEYKDQETEPEKIIGTLKKEIIDAGPKVFADVVIALTCPYKKANKVIIRFLESGNDNLRLVADILAGRKRHNNGSVKWVQPVNRETEKAVLYLVSKLYKKEAGKYEQAYRLLFPEITPEIDKSYCQYGNSANANFKATIDTILKRKPPQK